MSLQSLSKSVRCSANHNLCRYAKSQLEFYPFLRLSVESRNLSTSHKMPTSQKVLNLENMNPNVRIMEYAVRGPLLIRATEIENELKKVRILIFVYYRFRQIDFDQGILLLFIYKYFIIMLFSIFRELKNLSMKYLKQILETAMLWDKSRSHLFVRYYHNL